MEFKLNISSEKENEYTIVYDASKQSYLAKTKDIFNLILRNKIIDKDVDVNLLHHGDKNAPRRPALRPVAGLLPH